MYLKSEFNINKTNLSMYISQVNAWQLMSISGI